MNRSGAALALGTAVFVTLFVGAGRGMQPNAPLETLALRALGAGALVLLHVLLSIGPLARAVPRLAGLRALRGPAEALVLALGAAHAVLAVVLHHSGGVVNPIVHVLTANPRWDSLAHFPFRPLGAAAGLLLLLAAAARRTKPAAGGRALAYLAWGLVVMHVALGGMQSGAFPVAALVAGLVWIVGVHAAAALQGAPGPVAVPATAGRAALGAGAVVAVSALPLVLAMGPFPPAVRAAEVETFAGWLHAEPVPSLLLRPPGRVEDKQVFARLLLTADDRRGVDDVVREYDGNYVNLRGRVVARGRHALVRVEPGSLERTTPTTWAPVRTGNAPPEPSTLAGEIVSARCWLGAMQPGAGKAHRACAALGLAGGEPALFVVPLEGGGELVLALLGADGEPLGAALVPWVGEPVEITGEVERLTDLRVLRADPTSFRRLSGAAPAAPPR